MKNLDYLLSIANAKKSCFKGDYFIPESWNCIGYKDYETDDARPGEIKVNPYDFFAACVRSIENSGVQMQNSTDLNENVIYGILPRTFTAWAHNNDSKIQSGTLLKTIMVLKMLKKYHVSILYMLPVFKTGDSYKKGELGSPYAIKDIYKIDENLHDNLLGEYSEEMNKTEFKALVEACHQLGIKVMVDFAYRTVARDNVLIAEHPEWFYWIKSEFKDSFKPPVIGDGGKFYYICKDTISKLYKSPELKSYLSNFVLPPNEINPEKWAEIKSGPVDGISERIEKEFGIIAVPGFSDVVNDTQPAWTDITYLRFYFDNYKEVQKYLPENQPPYIMQDGASLSTFHGEEKNQKLWDYVIGTLPYYNKEFGIDGARIDMAHALPAELNAKIISEIRKQCPEFLLWSEELVAENGGQAKNDGFDFISGFTYTDYKKVSSPVFNKKIIEDNYLKSEIPLAASLETPDTPRSAYIHKNPDILKLLLIINSFMPNSVPYINCGQELLEIQPMNLGLDNNENGRFVLPENDPMYGKLAFFDTCYLHWTSESKWYRQVLCDIMEIRDRNKELIKTENFIKPSAFYRCKKPTAICYYDKEKEKGIIIAANRSENNSAVLNLKDIIPAQDKSDFSAITVYDKNGICKNPITTGRGLNLGPCEVEIIQFTTAIS